MPYKFNETRRHKIPRAKYRVTNWPEYDAALVRRGSLTVWITEEAVAAWQAPATGKRGGRPATSRPDSVQSTDRGKSRMQRAQPDVGSRHAGLHPDPLTRNRRGGNTTAGLFVHQRDTNQLNC